MPSTAKDAQRDASGQWAGLPAAAATGLAMALLNLSFLVSAGTLAAAPLGRQALAAGVAGAIVAALVGGLLVPLATRRPGEVTAPASSIVVIYAALGADVLARAGPGAPFGQLWASLSLAVVLMGLLLWIAGTLKLAEAVKFLPSPVTAGFVTGIGLLVVWSQLPALLAVPGKLSEHRIGELAALARPGALACGLLAMAVVWSYPRLKLPGPPMIAALVLGTLAHHALAQLPGATDQLGPTLDALAPASTAQASLRSAWAAVTPSWLLATLFQVLPYAAFLALQGVMNAGVTGAAVANTLGTRPRVNDTLRAQGLANMACGLLAALPVTSNSTLSAHATRHGAGFRLLAASATLPLLVTLVAGDLLRYLPVSVLAGLLVMSGFGLVDRWARTLATQVFRTRGREAHLALNLALVVAVTAAFFIGSVPLALLVGAVLAMVLLAVSLSRATTFTTQIGSGLGSTRAWAPEQAAQLAGRRDAMAIVRPRGGLFFGTADQLSARLAALPPQTRYCIVDLTRVTTIDATACQILAHAVRTLAARPVSVLLAGIVAGTPRHRELVALGLDAVPAARWFADADHALESVEAEILQDGSGNDDGAAGGLARTPITQGLSEPEFAQLRSVLALREVAAGPLFERGLPASSMFLVDSGRVEISVKHPETGKRTRLAAFGPGSIFGEVSLLSTGERSADALCVTPSRLYELDRAGMEDLQRRAPAVHAHILQNLGIHLANRLVIATATVQAQQ